MPAGCWPSSDEFWMTFAQSRGHYPMNLVIVGVAVDPGASICAHSRYYHKFRERASARSATYGKCQDMSHTAASRAADADHTETLRLHVTASTPAATALSTTPRVRLRKWMKYE